MSGWIRLSKSIFDHEEFAGEPLSRREAWLWLIVNAAWKDTKHKVSGKTVPVPRGSLFASYRQLQAAWRWPSLKRVRTFLKHLQDGEMIGLKTGTGMAHLTICNYDKYQKAETETGTRGAQQGHTEGHSRGTAGAQLNPEEIYENCDQKNKAGFKQTQGRDGNGHTKGTNKQINKEDTTLKARAGGFTNFKGLSDLLCEAAGLTDETKSPGHLSLADPLHWIENGCDLEADILPTIRSRTANGFCPSSWNYFTKPVLAARDRRLAPAPVSPIRQQSHSRPVSVAEAAMRKVQGQ